MAHRHEDRPIERADEVKLSLTEHLSELRERLIKSLLALIAGFCLCYALIDPIFALMARPLREVLPPETTLIFTSYPEAFFTYLKLALTCGLFVGSPLILYQIWAFVAPGLYEKEKRWALPLTIISSLFFVGGGLFGYMVVFPAAFRFLASYSGENLRLLPSVTEYFTLTVRLLLGFGIAFELPIFMVLLAAIGLIDARMLRKNRKYAILAIFAISAVLTPTPDILNQCLMAGPLIILYEISILLVWLVRRQPREPAKPAVRD